MERLPIPFIIETDGKFEVTREAEGLLSVLADPVAVVCVAGMQRTGKSFLLNQLSSQRCSFNVGNKIHACTKGISDASLTPDCIGQECGFGASLVQQEANHSVLFSSTPRDLLR